MPTVNFQRGLTNLRFHKQYMRERISKCMCQNTVFYFFLYLSQYGKKNGESLEYQFAFAYLVWLKSFYVYLHLKVTVLTLLENVYSHPILIVKTKNLKLL